MLILTEYLANCVLLESVLQKVSGFVNDIAALNVFGETPAETSLHGCLNH